MEFYRYDPDSNNFNAYYFRKDDEHLIQMHWKDAPLSHSWRLPELEGFDDNPGVDGDFPSLNNFNQIPIFSEHAWKVLGPLIGNYSEALPVRIPGDTPYYIINVMRIIDCLDEERSEIVRNAATGRVSHVLEYWFQSELLRGYPIFKLPLKSGSDLIVTDDFCRIVVRNHLKGLLFHPLSGHAA